MNLGKSGLTSFSVGPRGSSISLGRKGTYINAGLPGTGLSVREKVGDGLGGKVITQNSGCLAGMFRGVALFAKAMIILIGGLALLCALVPSDKDKETTPALLIPQTEPAANLPGSDIYKGRDGVWRNY